MQFSFSGSKWMTVDENIRDAASISDAQPHSIAFAFGGVFPHYKGDSNTTKLTIKRQILGGRSTV